MSEEKKSCKEQANEVLLDQLKKLAKRADETDAWADAAPMVAEMASAMATIAAAISPQI